MNNRDKEKMTKKSGCEISDNDSGLGRSIRNDDAYPSLPHDRIMISIEQKSL